MALNVSTDELRDLLVSRLEVMDQAEFERAQNMATRVGIPLERALVERGRIPFDFLLEQLAQAWGVRFVNLKVSDVNPDSLRMVREDFARSNTLVPFARDGKELLVAMWDPRNKRVIDEVERFTGLRVVPYLAPARAIQRAQLLYQGDVRAMLERAASGAPDAAKRPGRAGEDDRSATDVLQRLLEYAAVCRASDIHIEPYELEVVVRCRIDGSLHEVLSLPPTALSPLAVRVKILSGLRIDERRAPQDGRFQADLGGLQIDFRVSTLPTLWGEKIVLRVLAKESIALDLEDLGLNAADHDVLFRNLMRPFGLLLITGPTGSGKTTTLHSALGYINKPERKIWTAEDPVEITQYGLRQVQVQSKIGFTFAAALRAFLRADPDVIMIGEMRDEETAHAGIEASLTGHLVFSTLHTNSAAETVVRLLDMGLDPFNFADALLGILAQRLVKRLCTNCKERYHPDLDEFVGLVMGYGESDFEKLGIRYDDKFMLHKSRGCEACNHTGYRGRAGIHELLVASDPVKKLIQTRARVTEIAEAARAEGMTTLLQDGILKALKGLTDYKQVKAVALK
jgi:type II secretory ATPase GspE/PulE/Tfp pilus assembly ATPase PilB-like protein